MARWLLVSATVGFFISVSIFMMWNTSLSGALFKRFSQAPPGATLDELRTPDGIRKPTLPAGEKIRVPAPAAPVDPPAADPVAAGPDPESVAAADDSERQSFTIAKEADSRPIDPVVLDNPEPEPERAPEPEPVAEAIPVSASSSFTAPPSPSSAETVPPSPSESSSKSRKPSQSASQSLPPPPSPSSAAVVVAKSAVDPSAASDASGAEFESPATAYWATEDDWERSVFTKPLGGEGPDQPTIGDLFQRYDGFRRRQHALRYETWRRPSDGSFTAADYQRRALFNTFYFTEQERDQCRALYADTDTVVESHYGHAFITLSTTHYWQATLTWAQSLRDTKTSVLNVVLLMVKGEDKFPQDFWTALAKFCVQVVYADPLPKTDFMNIPEGWILAWHKLNVFNVTQYDKLIWMDSDTLVLQNIDDLFKHPHFTAAGTPLTCCQRHYEYYTISGGLWVFEPDRKILEHMVNLSHYASPDPVDLSQFGGRWHWGDMEMIKVVFHQQWNMTHLLSFEEYDVPSGHCKCDKQIFDSEVKTVHFGCSMGKPWRPWKDGDGGIFLHDCLKDFEKRWIELFERAIGRPSRRSPYTGIID